MARKSLKTQSILSGILIKLVIVLLVLLVASYLKLRVDFSKNKVYSLSTVSREAVKSLKDNMVVKIYASQELPSELSALDRYLKDLLAEYQMAGRGKFHYEFIKGLSTDELRTQANQNGLKSMYFRIYENDKTTSKEIIYGLVFEYQGNIAALNLMPRSEAKLEYELTLKIQKLARHSLPEISMYSDSLFTLMPTKVFSEGVNANFNVVPTDLYAPPKQTKVLLFTGVIDSLSTTQLYNLDQYLMKGGSLVVMQDRVATDGQSIFALQSNIFDLLEHYGIKLSSEIVMDIFCDVRQMGIDTSISFPVYPVLRGSEHPITRNISDIVMYLASGIAFTKQAGLKFIPILRSSTSSALLEGPDYELDPELFQSPDPEVFQHPPITMGTAVEGTFTSYFTDKPQFQTKDFAAKTDKSKIVVFGDRELYVDADKSIYNDRHYIVLNAMDWLLDRESMIAIRSRHLQSSILDIAYYMNKKQIVWGDLPKIERRIKLGIKVASAVLPSFFLILVGLLIALRRKQLSGEHLAKE